MKKSDAAQQQLVSIERIYFDWVTLPNAQPTLPSTSFETNPGKWSRLHSVVLSVDNTTGINTNGILIQCSQGNSLFVHARTETPLTAFGFDGIVAFGIGLPQVFSAIDVFHSSPLPDVWLPPATLITVASTGLDPTAELTAITVQLEYATRFHP